jgi:hypothetical protein
MFKKLSSLPGWLIPLALFVGTLAFYIYTLQPGLAWGDGIRLQREVISAESFIQAEISNVDFAPDPYPFARLGVAAWDHPLYVIFGHTLVTALPMVESLWLVNLISAVFGAGTIAVLYALLYRHTQSIIAAGFAALSLAVSHTFWWHAATPEVYTLFAFLLLLTLWFYDTAWQTGRFAPLIGAVFCLGLGLANHLLAGLAVPALLLFTVWHWRSKNKVSLRNPVFDGRDQLPTITIRRLIWLAIAFAIGFAPYWVQLLRLLRTFPLAELLGPAIGTTFFSGSLARTPAALGQSITMYIVFLFYNFGPFGVGLGLLGWIKGREVSPRLWRMMLLLYAVYVTFGLVYQVSDQFAFFMGAHVCWAVGMGLGVAWLERRISRKVRSWIVVGLIVSLVVMPPLYAVAPGLLRSVGMDDSAFGIPQIGTGVRDGLRYYLNPNKRGDHEAEDFGRNVLANLPPDALILAEWYTDTDEYFVLRYYTAVEELRPDITIEGWPTVDPFQFDLALSSTLIEQALTHRPVYLASLNSAFYSTATLSQHTCITPEHNLYRIHFTRPITETNCLTISD